MEGDKRWGELGDDSANFTSPYLLSFDDVEKLSKCFVATSPTKNVKPETTIVTQMMPVSYFSVDVLTQHNIQLVVYIKKMQELVTQIQSSFMKTDIDNIPCVPAPPVLSQIQQNTSLQITRKGAQQLLHKAVFDICAHEGFHSTSESVLSVLKDVTEDMLIKFCTSLKVNTEREQCQLSTGFTDALERTLHDVGINGIKDLHGYYVNRIRSYNERLKIQAEQTRQACIKAAINWTKKPISRPSWDDSEWAEWSGHDNQNGDDSFRIRRDSSTGEHLTEYSSNGEAVHQLHLEDNPTTLTPSLEPGLRMLYTLEQEAAAGAQGSVITDDLTGILTSPSTAATLPVAASPHNSSGNKNGIRKKRKN